MREKTLVIIPTYNEKANIARLIKKIRELKIPVDILVVDDSSPDKTGEIVKQIAKSDSGVYLFSRKAKEGLGKAYVAGFKWAKERKYTRIFSMDADFSHPPEALREMLRLSNYGSVVIGSRYIKGGKIIGWAPKRYLNSWCANWVTRSLLFIRAKDATAGFKCYPMEFLGKINLDNIQASGYAFQVEMLLLAQDNGFKLVETPITFTDRMVGESKIQGELKKSAKIVFKLASQRPIIRQFAKFAIVGLVNTAIDWILFFPFKTAIGGIFSVNSDLQTVKQGAKALSFVVSASTSYLMNRKWTFRSKNKDLSREITKFFVVAMGGLIINSLVFYLVTGVFGLGDIVGLLFATASATFWNFILNKKWTFKK